MTLLYLQRLPTNLFLLGKQRKSCGGEKKKIFWKLVSPVVLCQQLCRHLGWLVARVSTLVRALTFCRQQLDDKKGKIFPFLLPSADASSLEGNQPKCLQQQFVEFLLIKNFARALLHDPSGWLTECLFPDWGGWAREALLSQPRVLNGQKEGFPPLSQTRLWQRTAESLTGTRAHLGHKKKCCSTSIARRPSFGHRQPRSQCSTLVCAQSTLETKQ